jgi:hypothetical protein
MGEDSGSYARSSPHQGDPYLAEYPARCHPGGPGSEPGKPTQRNAFGEYGRTRHRRCCPSGPAHDHDNCDTASAFSGAHAHVDVNPEPVRPLGPTLMAVRP